MKYLILIAILFMLYQIFKRRPSRPSNSNDVKGTTQAQVQQPPFDPGQVEDIEYRSVNKKDKSE